MVDEVTVKTISERVLEYKKKTGGPQRWWDAVMTDLEVKNWKSDAKNRKVRKRIIKVWDF